jgi:hypothetical protein
MNLKQKELIDFLFTTLKKEYIEADIHIDFGYRISIMPEIPNMVIAY